MVPNHALIILGLLYGDDDFQRSLMIVNTAGWDTDCNSGNVGCLLGIKNGLAGIDAGPDWRGPVADRLYLATADGGRAITDAVTETYHVVNIGRALAGEAPLAPKDGARFHFELPGSVQGFAAPSDVDARRHAARSKTSPATAPRPRSLALRYRHLAPGRVARAATPTFIPPDVLNRRRLQPARLAHALPRPDRARRARRRRGQCRPDRCPPLPASLRRRRRPASHSPAQATTLAPGDARDARLAHPRPRRPADRARSASSCWHPSAAGRQRLPRLAHLGRCARRDARSPGRWRHASGDAPGWMASTSSDRAGPRPYRIVQNHGTGLLSQGTRRLGRLPRRGRAHRRTSPRARALAVRVQGLRRYYALLLRTATAPRASSAFATARRSWPSDRSPGSSGRPTICGSRLPARTYGPGSTASCCSISTIPLRRSLVVQLVC